MSCAGTVRDAFIALLEAESFEQAIRNAISIGGDADTLAAICGSIAEPIFGISDKLIQEVEKRITPDMKVVLCNFFIERYGDGPDDIWNQLKWKESLENHFISTISPDNIWACAGAAGGAMGDPGTIKIIYTDEQKKIHYFYANWASEEIDLDLLAKRFEPLNAFAKTGMPSKGWSFYYLGYGNSCYT